MVNFYFFFFNIRRFNFYYNKNLINWDTRQHVVKIIVNRRIMFEFMVIKYGHAS